MRVSEAHQLKDGSQVTASDPQFGKTVKDMPRYEHVTGEGTVCLLCYVLEVYMCDCILHFTVCYHVLCHHVYI